MQPTQLANSATDDERTIAMSMTAFLESVPPERADNARILQWWTDDHDAAVQMQMQTYDWHYPLTAPRAVAGVTAPETLDKWRSEDPLCAQYSWDGVLANFVIARSRKLGLDRIIAPACEKTCQLCSSSFYEDEVPKWGYTKVGGRYALDFCEPCSRRAFQPKDVGPTAVRPTAAEVEEFAKSLAEVAQIVPSQDFFDPADCLAGYDREVRIEIMRLAQRRPTKKIFEKTHRSWFHVLVASGVIESAQRTGRGTRSLAEDGHVCLSLGEKTIDDWLSRNGIPHGKEPAYPGSRMRADFVVDGIYIEYFGLVGDSAYDERIERKRLLATAHNIKLVEIYPKDLASWSTAQKAIADELGVVLPKPKFAE
ncbi:hypothetical protein ABIC73_004361 [Prescottella equi]|uniref:hypothetical protein n=1 Tax=Rhodococcus hoagii TaxID=43767 RepID=UPI003396C84D